MSLDELLALATEIETTHLPSDSRTKESFFSRFLTKKKEEKETPRPELQPLRPRKTIKQNLKDPATFEFVERDLLWRDPRKDEDLSERDLIIRYQEGKDPDDLESIYTRNQDFLKKQVNSISGFRLPKPALEGRVYNKFQKAIETWDPNKGANIRTYFTQNYARNMRRDARTDAQFARSNRRLVAKTERVLQLQESLEMRNNRLPTAEEIALAGKPGELKIEDVQKILEQSKGDLLGSKKLDSEQSFDVEQSARFAVHRVRDYYNAQEKKALDHLFGLNGATYYASNNSLAKKLGVPASTLSTLKAKFRKDIETEMRHLGV